MKAHKKALKFRCKLEIKICVHKSRKKAVINYIPIELVSKKRRGARNVARNMLPWRALDDRNITKKNKKALVRPRTSKLITRTA